MEWTKENIIGVEFECNGNIYRIIPPIYDGEFSLENIGGEEHLRGRIYKGGPCYCLNFFKDNINKGIWRLTTKNEIVFHIFN